VQPSALPSTLTSPRFEPSPIGLGADPCVVHKDCGSCIHDPLKTCGWCDGMITFGDGSTCGSDGAGCCGGDSGFSHCNVAYRKECPVTCDWKNWTHPVCRPASGKEMNDPKVQKFPDCETVHKWHACGEPPSPSPSPTPPHPSPPSIVYCEPGVGCQGPVNKSTCESNPHCDPAHPTCNPNQCKAPPPKTYYACDAHTAQCSLHSGVAPAGMPAFNTSTECKEKCYDSDLSGTWRGLRIEDGFVSDEWDVTFSGPTSGNVTFVSTAHAQTLSGAFTVGASLVAETFPSFKIDIQLSNGASLAGLFSNRDTGPVTRFLYLGLGPTSAAAGAPNDYSGAMAKGEQEFVLVACLPTVHDCSFATAVAP